MCLRLIDDPSRTSSGVLVDRHDRYRYKLWSSPQGHRALIGKRGQMFSNEEREGKKRQWWIKQYSKGSIPFYVRR